MQNQRRSSSRNPVAKPTDLGALRPALSGALTPASTPLPGTKLLLVDFRSGETISKHPEIQSYLRQGWRVKSAAPRLVEAGGTKLFVVLTHMDAAKSVVMA